MRSCRPLWLLACAVLIGCGSAASEGGVTGTGISAISGNVVEVSEPQVAQSDTVSFAIRVTIDEFPTVAGSTDADGTFELDGAFSGAVTLRFTNADDGTEIGPLHLEVPSGSQTLLENIEIHLDDPPTERVRPRAVRQFDAFGRTDVVECNGDGTGTLLLTDVGRPPRQYMVTLTADTDIASDGDDSLTCADITSGIAVRVSGFVRRDDRSLIAVSIAVAAVRPPQPGPSPRPEQLRGTVKGVDCERGLVDVEQRGIADLVHRIVRLTDQTEVQCPAGRAAACDCSAIAVGQPIAVAGVVLPQRPGQVRADVVILGVTSVPVDFTAVITRLGCAVSGLGVQDVDTRQSVRVVVTDATQILCTAEQPCRCADLRLRERVHVIGQRPPEGGPVTADRIAVLR